MSTINPFGLLAVKQDDEDEEKKAQQETSLTANPLEAVLKGGDKKRKRKVRPEEKKKMEEEKLRAMAEKAEKNEGLPEPKGKSEEVEDAAPENVPERTEHNMEVPLQIGYSKPIRERKRYFDRHSGTGRGREIAKAGAGGKATWGSNEEWAKNEYENYYYNKQNDYDYNKQNDYDYNNSNSDYRYGYGYGYGDYYGQSNDSYNNDNYNYQQAQPYRKRYDRYYSNYREYQEYGKAVEPEVREEEVGAEQEGGAQGNVEEAPVEQSVKNIPEVKEVKREYEEKRRKNKMGGGNLEEKSEDILQRPENWVTYGDYLEIQKTKKNFVNQDKPQPLPDFETVPQGQGQPQTAEVISHKDDLDYQQWIQQSQHKKKKKEAPKAKKNDNTAEMQLYKMIDLKLEEEEPQHTPQKGKGDREYTYSKDQYEGGSRQYGKRQYEKEKIPQNTTTQVKKSEGLFVKKNEEYPEL